MAAAGGYVLILPKDRMAVFSECLREEQRFSQEVIDFQHSRNAPLICFVVSGRKLAHIALGRRGTSGGTGNRILRLDKAESLPEPLAVHRILKLLPSRIKSSVQRRFLSGGLLTSKGFGAVVEAVQKLAPESSAILAKYSNERKERLGRLSPKIRESLAYQKEAVLTALSIADIDRTAIQDWVPPDGTPISFLDGLPSARLREDPMVVHDLMHLPGFDILKTYPYNAAVFESDSERLTVILANRLPLEEQTGTDLIYYNETFQSFVMVQYKAMERDDDDNGNINAGFRIPNNQLAEEIARMDSLLTELKACDPNTVHDGFRLTENPFFLKLCSRLVFNPDDISLVPGMYLPLDYWKLLEQHDGIKGPRGGRRVTYENVGRHFDNSAFITVVAKAWVGTTPRQSAVLKKAIRQTLETGKAVAIAVKLKKPAQGSTLSRKELSEVRPIE